MIRWLLVMCVCRFASVLGQNSTDGHPESIFDYYSMPVLSELDDFDLCLKKPDAVYCLINLQIFEEDIPLYQYIKNVSLISYKNYQHTILQRGVCGSKHCGLNISHADAGELTVKKLKNCMNATLHKEYGLQVDTVSIQYCKTQNDGTPPDALDYIVGALIIMLLLINLGCSLYYEYFPKENGKDNKILLAFCVQKNWKALKDGGNADGGLVKCFQALRFYSMVIIISAHVFFFISVGYTANPEFIEQAYDDNVKVVFFNTRVILQIFFVMGGFLMTQKILLYTETYPISFKIICRNIINRWLRLMPAALVVMGLTMTWIARVDSGPFWDVVVNRARERCRTNWWQLVILMPNLFPTENICLMQTWYLGADFQLFLITMIVLLVIWRWPKSGIPVLSSVMFISLLVSFLQTYLMNLLSIRASLSPELFRHELGNSDTFFYAYVSPQSNWAGYHLGVITAYFHRTAQTKKWNFSNNFLMKTLFLFSVPVCFATIYLGSDLHHRKASAFESAIFNTLNQNIFALALCVFIIGYFYRCNRIYVNIFEWGPSQPLGTLSYGAMLIHFVFLRIYFGQMRRLSHVTIYSCTVISAGIVILSYFGALLIHLFVEAPASQLQILIPGLKPEPIKIESSNKTK